MNLKGQFLVSIPSIRNESQKEIIYKGNVQGVAFRWNTNDVIMGFAVTGYVKNLSDEWSFYWRVKRMNSKMLSAVEERMWILDERELEYLPRISLGKFYNSLLSQTAI